jgi:hypothetical protein
MKTWVEEWSGEPTLWWLDGQNDENVLVRPGDQCRFESAPHAGTVLVEVASRGPLQ